MMPDEGAGRGMAVRRRLELALVFVIAIAAHAVSIGNEYALDDEIIIHRNIFVQRGVSGIPDILRNGMYDSFFDTMSAPVQPAAARWRPLSAITFAIEQSVFGRTLGDEYLRLEYEADLLGPAHPRAGELRGRLRSLLESDIRNAGLEIARARHAVQVVLFAVSMVALLTFLRRLFPEPFGVAFVAILIFALHPIHTEVVANLKSRDEILSLLFIALTGIAMFRYDERRLPRDMGLAATCLALALLSKEYAIVAPVVLGTAIVLARGRTPLELARSFAPLLPVIAAYLVLRTAIVGDDAMAQPSEPDVITDPFLPLRDGSAEGSVVATKLAILLRYARLLVVPHPLSADYSYAALPYHGWASLPVVISLALHLAIVALTVFAFRKRSRLGFCGVAYLLFLLPVSNLPFDVGLTMGERLAYHASWGGAVFLAWAIVELPARFVPGARRVVTWGLVLAIAITSAVATARREREWKNDRTLFLADVRTVPGSAVANGNAGAQILGDALETVRESEAIGAILMPDEENAVVGTTARALDHLERAVSIHEGYANAWINIGIARYLREEHDEATRAFRRAAEIHRGHPAIRQYASNYHARGMQAAQAGELPAGVEMLRRATTILPDELQFWRDYAGASYTAMKFGEAAAAFERILAIAPGDPDATGGLRAANGMAGLERAAGENPGDPVALRALASSLAGNDIPAFRERARLLEIAASSAERNRR